MDDTEDAGEREEIGQIYEVVEKMLADEFGTAEEVRYYNLTLVRHESYHNLWRVFNSDDQVINTVNLGAFRSVEEIAEWLNEYVREEASDGDD